MTKEEETLFQLYAPFKQVYERKGPGGKSLRYVTARMVMNRLTDVLGPENWSDEYEIFGDRVICKIHVKVKRDDGSYATITRCDTGEPGQGEDLDGEKSLFSDAFKRAAVKFGIALYLYNDGVPAKAMAYFENGSREYALPTKVQATNGSAHLKPAEWAPNYNCPKHGKALWAWAKDREREFSTEAISIVLNDPEIKGIYPKFMGDWSEDQVKTGYLKMVQVWKSSGKWPIQDQQQTQSRTLPTSQAQSSSSIQPPPSEEVIEIKQDLRNKTTELIHLDRGIAKEDIKYNVFLDCLNSFGNPHNIHIDNWASYRDKSSLLHLLSLVSDSLEKHAGLDIPLEDIPF